MSRKAMESLWFILVWQESRQNLNQSRRCFIPSKMQLRQQTENQQRFWNSPFLLVSQNSFNPQQLEAWFDFSRWFEQQNPSKERSFGRSHLQQLSWSLLETWKRRIQISQPSLEQRQNLLGLSYPQLRRKIQVWYQTRTWSNLFYLIFRLHWTWRTTQSRRSKELLKSSFQNKTSRSRLE